MASEFAAAIDDVVGVRDVAALQTTSTIEDNPDQAARALELEQVTGTPAPVIFGALEDFERNNRLRMASQIVSQNEHLSGYVASSQMAGRVSNDDYGQLDTVSQALTKLGNRGVIQAVIDGWGKGAGPGAVGSWQLRTQKDIEFAQKYPWSSMAYTILGLPIEVPFRTLSGVISAAGEGAGQAYQNITGDPNGAKYGEQFAQFVQDPGVLASIGIPLPPRVTIREAQAHNRLLRDQVNQVDLYVRDGKEPPVGMSPVLDALKAEQAELDLGNLAEALRESVKSKTRERAPEMYADFVRQHGDATIGITPEAIQRLYGEKLPEPGDNILGWVPDIQKKYQTALEAGTDVEIPLADFLAKVDPQVAKGLEDGIRVREAGITREEAKLQAEEAAAGIEQGVPVEVRDTHAVEVVRRNAAMAPMFIDVFHGSPHEFAAFDISKVGTGEGAQSYGHGLYFAENRKVAQGYQERLGGRTIEGVPFDEKIPAHKAAEFNELFKNGTDTDLKGIMETMRRDIAAMEKSTLPGDKKQLQLYKDTLAILESGKIPKFDQGHLLRARIKAPREEFVDWDRPLREQPEKVKNFIIKKIMETGKTEAEARAVIEGSNILAGDWLGAAGSKGGSHGFIWANAAEASKEMHEAGIPGIRYLDQGSRDLGRIEQDGNLWKVIYREAGETIERDFKSREEAEAFNTSLGEKTSNFVLFDDKLVDITHKNDVAIAPTPPSEAATAKKARKPRQPKQLAFDFSTLDERDAFAHANAVGMTVDQFKRYMRLVEKQKLEDLDAATKKAIADERRRQTDEWRENEAKVREEVIADLRQRPDLAADRFFREGILYDETVPERPKLSTEYLSPEQQEALPKSFQAARGMHPDDAANLLGFDSGTTLIEQLAKVHADRMEIGGRPGEFFRKLVSAETELEMQRRYGDLRQNILREAQDAALTATQIDILHEEVFALAARAGAEFSLQKGDLARWTAERFGDTLASSVSVDKYLAAAGKAGRAAEVALLKGDAVLAFREKQRQYLAVRLAKEATAFAKEQARFERAAERFGKREVKGVDQAFTDYVQELLVRAGLPVQRSLAELNEAQASRPWQNLQHFTETHTAQGWDLAVSPRVAAGEFLPLSKMSVADFREFNDAIQSLIHVGREQRQITVGEAKREFAEFKKEVIDNITSRPALPPEKQNRLRTRLDAELVKMEEVMKDLDLHEELGPLFNAVIRPMQEAKALEYRMQNELAQKLGAIKKGFGKEWMRTLDDTIPQNFLIDPYIGAPFDLTRGQMINIMLNFGNRSNVEKFVRGYVEPGLKGDEAKQAGQALEAQLRQLFDRHATKEDWQYVQHIWDIFEGWRKDADAMYRRLSGVAPKWIDIEPFQTAQGEIRGGYFPIIYDRLRSAINVIEDKPSANKDLFGPNYFRATTANKYTLERTGFTDYVQFDNSIEQVGARMQQMIHDIAFRPAVMETSKVLYDREIRAAIRKHYGMEYEAQLDPWLKDIANSFNFDELKVGAANAIMRRARVNLIAHTLPLNLKVIFSPSTGMTNPVQMFKTLWDRGENVVLAHEKSLEIPNTLRTLDRDFREMLESTIASKGWRGAQADAVRWFWTPMVKMEQGFRITTFVSEYKGAMKRGLSESDAIALADSKVRERHGAAGLPDLPAIMRSNEAMKIATTFYGWFNTMYNWQRQIPDALRRGDVKDAWQATWGAVLVPAAFGMMFVKTHKDDTWFSIMAKSLLTQPINTLPFVRDASTMFVEGFKPGTPLGSILQAFYSATQDVKKAVAGKRVEKPIQHGANVIGLGAGVPLAQVGRTGQFAYDVAQGHQRPRNILEWIRGITQGEARPKR